MVHQSRAIGTKKAATYFEKHFKAQESSRYYSAGGAAGQWQGDYARELGLDGAVDETAFLRMVKGYAPTTGRQLIKEANSSLVQKKGYQAHRAGWDLTFNSSKSVSLTALVGGDFRIVEAHDRAVFRALRAGEEYAQARGGGSHPAITTGKWAVATFRHDTARPEISGEQENAHLYPAPHLHTHSFLMNMVKAPDGQVRSFQPAEIFRIQGLMRSVYQSEMKSALRSLGYEVQSGKNGAAEIAGYTDEYLSAESLRSKRIKDKMVELGLNGRRATDIIAHQDREEKLDLSDEEVKKLHSAHAMAFGNQPQKIVEAALKHEISNDAGWVTAHDLVSAAMRSLSDREAVFEHHQLVTKALDYGHGHVLRGEILRNIDERSFQSEEMKRAGILPELVEVSHVREDAPGKRFTTLEMLRLEREVLQMTVDGRGQSQPILPGVTTEALTAVYAHLYKGQGPNEQQAEAARVLLTTGDQIAALQGAAGSGKTTSTLRIVREQAEAAGYQVIGLAPTTRARDELAAEGFNAQTLQAYLIRQSPERIERARQQYEKRLTESPERAEVFRQKLVSKGIDISEDGPPRLLVVDESSLASTKQYHELLTLLRSGQRPGDRVIEVGDVYQHESVEAGRIFEEQQEAGMTTAQLDKIVRQDPEQLIKAIEAMQYHKPARAMRILADNGWITEDVKREQRHTALAKEYAEAPEGTTVVTPGNKGRRDLGVKIREALRNQKLLAREDSAEVSIYVPRQDVTKEDYRFAASYQINNVVRFNSANSKLGVEADQTGVVTARDITKNTVTIRFSDGRERSFDPRKVDVSTSLYEVEHRALAVGERVSLKSQWREKALANGTTLAIRSVDANGNIEAVVEKTGRVERFNARNMPYMDYAYVSTSYSIQGATSRRTLIDMDTTERGARQLLSEAMAYVAISRPREAVRLYTDNVQRLVELLSTGRLKTKALAEEQIVEYAPAHHQKAMGYQPTKSQEQTAGMRIA